MMILYACVHNGGRSVAAEALTRWLDPTLHVRSAGSEPGSSVNPMVAEVLRERGLSVDGHVPSLLTPASVEIADVVVTMGCGETCPIFPGKRSEDWDLPDPTGQDVETVRAIVDAVEVRVRALLASL